MCEGGMGGEGIAGHACLLSVRSLVYNVEIDLLVVFFLA